MSAHKNAAIICQWVSGLPIQGRETIYDDWIDIPDVDTLGDGANYLEPSPIHPDYDHWKEWRVNWSKQ